MSASRIHAKEKNRKNKYNSKRENQLQNTDVETSAEFIDPAEYNRAETTGTSTRNSVGIVALVLSIASLFILPVILGILGILVGIFATKADSRIMGIAAIVIGVFSVFAGLLVYPFF